MWQKYVGSLKKGIDEPGSFQGLVRNSIADDATVARSVPSGLVDRAIHQRKVNMDTISMVRDIVDALTRNGHLPFNYIVLAENLPGFARC